MMLFDTIIVSILVKPEAQGRMEGEELDPIMEQANLTRLRGVLLDEATAHIEKVGLSTTLEVKVDLA